MMHQGTTNGGMASPSYVAPLSGLGRNNGVEVPMVTSMHPTINMNEPSMNGGNSVIGGGT
jgi:hypothetical protein